MTGINPKNAKTKLRELITKYAPDLTVKQLIIEGDVDFAGAEVLRVKIIYSKRAKNLSEFSQQRIAIADEFHEWLLSQADVRFPHFTFRSEVSEQELQKEALEHD